MKAIFILASAAILLHSCGPATPAEQTVSGFSTYGAAFDTTGAIAVADLQTAMTGKDSLHTRLQCKIVQSCKKAGCWMDVENPNGEPITVFMKDHSFGIPLEGCEGLEAIVDGKVYYDTLDVAYLQHLAEDAGKTAEEIAAITEPKFVLAVDASGVMLKGAPQTGHEGHDHEGHDHGEEEATH
jgi:hypothetical protein